MGCQNWLTEVRETNGTWPNIKWWTGEPEFEDVWGMDYWDEIASKSGATNAEIKQMEWDVMQCNKIYNKNKIYDVLWSRIYDIIHCNIIDYASRPSFSLCFAIRSLFRRGLIFRHTQRLWFENLRLLELPEATSALTQLGVDIFAVKEYSKLLGPKFFRDIQKDYMAYMTDISWWKFGFLAICLWIWLFGSSPSCKVQAKAKNIMGMDHGIWQKYLINLFVDSTWGYFIHFCQVPFWPWRFTLSQ